ncbi:hypothetical protein L1987_77904 [Smallanthus sonchifolius]|uniref:Uncharacterized protein n=1 Tax=Smallanthus sonchifolius TaxID=185202 RepID=A0ACB8ZC92_9ASTR|nr:hypothetical protein L1987_77904 [Smallanthus sonchifolius]
MMQIAREFFNLPEEERLKSYSDDPSKTTRLSTSFNIRTEKVANWRDFLRLHCYPLEDYVHEWPTNPAYFRDHVAEYCRSVRGLALQLIEAISESLGLDKDYISRQLGQHGQHMALNYYPPCPQPDLTYGLPRHTDLNLIKILLQDDVPGLQVLRNGLIFFNKKHEKKNSSDALAAPVPYPDDEKTGSPCFVERTPTALERTSAAVRGRLRAALLERVEAVDIQLTLTDVLIDTMLDDMRSQWGYSSSDDNMDLVKPLIPSTRQPIKPSTKRPIRQPTSSTRKQVTQSITSTRIPVKVTVPSTKRPVIPSIRKLVTQSITSTRIPVTLPVPSTRKPVTQSITSTRIPIKLPVPSTKRLVTQLIPSTRKPVKQSVLSTRKPLKQSLLSTRKPIPIPSTRKLITQSIPSTRRTVKQPITSTRKPVTQLITSARIPIEQPVPSNKTQLISSARKPIKQSIPCTSKPVKQSIPCTRKLVKQSIPCTRKPVKQSIPCTRKLVKQSIPCTRKPVKQSIPCTRKPLKQSILSTRKPIPILSTSKIVTQSIIHYTRQPIKQPIPYTGKPVKQPIPSTRKPPSPTLKTTSTIPTTVDDSHYQRKVTPRWKNSRVLYSGCWCISCIAEFDKMDVRFLTNTHLLQETPNSCMHLMCTAIHSSNCLSCCTVVLHFFLSPLLVAQGFVPLSLSNVILMVAVSCYHYPNFLGCDGKKSFDLGDHHYPYTHLYSDKMIFQHLQREFEAALASQTQVFFEHIWLISVAGLLQQ